MEKLLMVVFNIIQKNFLQMVLKEFLFIGVFMNIFIMKLLMFVGKNKTFFILICILILQYSFAIWGCKQDNILLDNSITIFKKPKLPTLIQLCASIISK